jgi:lambda family phage portal protein
MSDLMQAVKQAMKPNMADRVVNYLNPVRGAARLRARAQMAIASAGIGGFTGARTNRRTTGGWATTSGSADSDSLPDIPTLRDRSRDLLRNAPLACGAVGTVVQNVVGTGLTLQSKPEGRRLGWSQEQASEWAAHVESEWRLWAESTFCDITRTQNFYGLQSLAFRSALESGDCLALLPMTEISGSPYKTRVQIIEADRLANPTKIFSDGQIFKDTGNRIYAGVEKSDAGAPVAYHILRQHPGNLIGRLSWDSDRYEAFGSRTGRRNVLHIYDRVRPDQSRGIPYLAPVIEMLHQVGKYTDAELMAAVISSFFTVFVKTPTGEGLNVTQSAAAAAAGISQQTSGSASTDIGPLQLGHGLIVDLADGDEIQTADPNRPNVAFDPFVQSLLRQIGVALGLPFEVLIMHFTASYTAARAAILMAWKFFFGRRQWLADFFCQPIYEAFLDEAVSLGRIAAPGYFADPAMRRAYLGSEWIGDAPGSIDPLKEVNAAKGRIELGVSSRQKETMELTGQVWEDVHAQQVRERQMRVRDGLESTLTVSTNPVPDKTGTDDDGGSDLEAPPQKGGR